MPKYKHGSGTIYQRTKTGPDGKKQVLKVWWLDYYHNGKRIRESSGTTDRAEAQRLLQQRLGQIADGKFAGPAADRVTFEELAADFLNEYRANGRKTLREAMIRVNKHLLPFFGGKTAHKINTTDVREFIAQRQEEGAENGTINCELSAFKRMFNLAMQAEKMARRPHIEMLEMNNVRKGFFERDAFHRLLAGLPDELRPPLTLAYLTGWRIKSEILFLTWARVDLDAGTVRLYRGTTKNKDGRVVYLFPELVALLAAQWQQHLTSYSECPFVFHRNGQRIKDFRDAWKRACREAGLSNRIPHDFRRSAVRNMVRAGIPERVAMQISGHRTRDVFERYNIVSEGDMKEAAEKMRRAFLGSNGHTFGHTSQFSQEETALSH